MGPGRIVAALTLAVLASASLWVAGAQAKASANAAFQSFIASLWPQAERIGVSRATFDAATRGLQPDLSLPDLVIPGRTERPARAQAEFVQPPSAYLNERAIANMAAQGRRLYGQHRATLETIEKRKGVPASVILAIWGRETSFGGTKLRHDALRILATQAWMGRRKAMFREEFLMALKILQDGDVSRGAMKSSWAGAMGQTQFLPSDFYKNAVDFDGDGRRDIWNSIPDALASAANHLVSKGWRPGHRWAHEVRVPRTVDCSVAHPGHTRTIAEWIAAGYVPAHRARPSPAEMREEASLLMPEGTHGPAFLTPKNYFVLKEYNFSDLYVLFVGHVADRIAGRKPFETPWSKTEQLRTADVERMQIRLRELGLYKDKIDGMAGMLTRAALGAYQKANGLPLDCWPNLAVLRHMQRN